MALIFMDGFDHYGTDESNLTAGPWAEANSVFSISSDNPRTGLNSIRFDYGNNQARVLRRVLGIERSRVGLGMGFFPNELPTFNREVVLFIFRNDENNDLVTIYVNSTGVIECARGSSNGTILGTTSQPAIVANAYNHIEAAIDFDGGSLGTVEIRVNGVTVMSLTGVQTSPDSSLCSQVCIGGQTGSTDDNIIVYYDDVFAWDDSGTENNDFLGDRRVRTSFVDSDQPTQEWSLFGSVTGYGAINQTAPDGDTTYIEADASVPVVSEFGLQDLPAGVGGIAAVMTYVMQRKTEAGDGNTQASMISNGTASNGADRPITPIYTYWTDVFELDPDTGAPWSAAAVNAATLRITRTV